MTMLAPAAHARPPADRARRLFWTALLLFVSALAIGFNWDRAWHVTHPFEDFWSPPHLFIYTMFGLTACVLARLAFTPALRPPFGGMMRLPVVGVAVPGALALAGGGLVVIGLAGAMDSIWHSAFGLDETGWSFPHAMLGWGGLLAFLGFISCRLALRASHPMAWYTRLLLGGVALMFITSVFTGPLGKNTTPERVRAIAQVGVLANEPAVQRVQQIYLEHNLTRRNPLFVLLSAAAAGVGLMVLRRVGGNDRVFIAAAVAVTLLTLSGERRTAAYLGLLDDPRAWLPLPLLPAALTLLLLPARLAERWAWLAAGLVFGALSVWFWDAPPVFVLAAAPLMLLGARVGAWLAETLEQPQRGRVLALVATCVCVPMLTGVADVWLRT